MEEQPMAVEEVAPLTGEPYLMVLERLHRTLKPARYLEIGSNTGDSLALAQCATIAVDPNFRLLPKFLGGKPLCALHQIESDRFFATTDPKTVLGGPVDLAFLDGMHLAEFLLRDFINIEPHCKPNSVIALHDCIPIDTVMARRNPNDRAQADGTTYGSWWTGDVWKAVVILRTTRPDLHVLALDAIPTGLILVTNLDPASTVLRDSYHTLARKMRNMDFPARSLAKYHEWLAITPTRELTSFEDIMRYFWV